MPIERRMRSSPTWRDSTGIEAWDIRHGKLASECKLPKLTEIVNSRSALKIRSDSCTLPVSKLITLPAPEA